MKCVYGFIKGIEINYCFMCDCSCKNPCEDCQSFKEYKKPYYMVSVSDLYYICDTETDTIINVVRKLSNARIIFDALTNDSLKK
ncbi:hypothetical protein [Anaeromicropila populeti]|uniref:Uncharacterized protein n=1 Tax=Anaeromicropila populeti TaxID=37658 RepID=A0A1I6L0W3_9FIRM|nr:hypothetical protein [Anaeromicropila populeti]SFR97094.1 hypothetical protein SAMN05661086_02968 [Anaeromicropila populeti]